MKQFFARILPLGILGGLLVSGIYLFFQKQKINALEHETEQIHDDAMKEMAAMNRVGRQLKKMAGQADSLQISASDVAQIAEVLLQMDKAEADMMVWMTGYKPVETWLPRAFDFNYLEYQKRSILLNQQDIHAALENGKKWIK